MKDRTYFSKHFNSDEHGEYVSISSTKFKMIVRQYREYETYCIELENENKKLKESIVCGECGGLLARKTLDLIEGV